MNLKSRIADLTMSAPGLSSTEIAERVGCQPAYVRTVWQRIGVAQRRERPTVKIAAPEPASGIIELRESVKQQIGTKLRFPPLTRGRWRRNNAGYDLVAMFCCPCGGSAALNRSEIEGDVAHCFACSRPLRLLGFNYET